MDAEQLLGTLIRGALGGRRKRNRGALRFLTGGRHSLLNAGTLLTAAGVAWGLYETATRQNAAPVQSAGADRGPVPPGTAGAAGAGVPPLPLSRGAGDPSREGSAADAPPVGGPEGASVAAAPPDVLRVIRLTIAAARADGALTPKEEEAILVHARTVGAESLVAQELRQPTPLPALVADVPPEQRADLYTLAFAVARADEAVTGGERIFLAQLAHQLGLRPDAVAELERVAVDRIAEGSASA